MSETTDRVEVRETDGEYRVKLPDDTCFYRVFGVVEKCLCRALIAERNAHADTRRQLENQHKVSNASSAIIVRLREDQEQIRGAMLQWRARCGEAETERDDYERTEPKKVAELVSLRATIAAKDKTLVAVEDECVKLQKDRDNLKSLFDDAVRTCGIVMRERDARVTPEGIIDWLKWIVTTKATMYPHALYHHAYYGYDGWRNRQKPEDGREGVEG